MKVAQHYNAIIKPVNFSNPSKAIDEINQWVKNATEGSISTIIGGKNVFFILPIQYNVLCYNIVHIKILF